MPSSLSWAAQAPTHNLCADRACKATRTHPVPVSPLRLPTVAGYSAHIATFCWQLLAVW